MSRPAGPHAGFTLPELVIVLVVAAATAAVGLRQAHQWLDHVATRGAVREAALVVSRARESALAQHALVTLSIDTAAGTLALAARGERFALHAPGHQYGVRLSTTRDSVSFDVRGLGYGAANFTLVARRGDAADTLVVSRLGRTRF